MAATLPIQSYLEHYLLNRDQQLAQEARKQIESAAEQRPLSQRSLVRKYSDAHLPAVTKEPNMLIHFNYGILLANVHQMTGDRDTLMYSKVITGNKTLDVFTAFVQDMIGSKAASISNGRLSRTSSVSDMSSIADDDEAVLESHTTIHIQLISSRSPSNIASAQMLGFIDHCKRQSIRATIQLKFAHAYTWDNKYNREALEALHEKGVKLKSMSFHEIIQNLMDDTKETIESFDQLETCRGTIMVDFTSVERAFKEFRQSLSIASDFYNQDQQEQLDRMLGRNSELPIYKDASHMRPPAALALKTYRDYMLLQNTDAIWSKLKVCVTKVANGTTKEDIAYESVQCNETEKTITLSMKNAKKSNTLDKTLIWKKVGEKVTIADLSECDTIVVTILGLISEYKGRVGWVEELIQLHNYVRDRVDESELYKVSVETNVRYAQSLDAPYPVLRSSNKSSKLMNGNANGSDITTIGFPHGMRLECLHVQDILFEMLEDLEDNMFHLGKIDYGRGGNLLLDKEGMTLGMGFLNNAFKVKIAGKVYSMNDEFADFYAEDMNGSI